MLEHFVAYFCEQAAHFLNFESNDQKIDFKPPSERDLTVDFLKKTPRKSIEFVQDNEILRFKLAPREIKCLEYMSLGYSVKEISYKLGISKHTVEFYIKSLKQKTGIYTTSKLITQFIKSNLAYLHYLANNAL